MPGPTPLQVQLALAIVRSKPTNCTIQEFVDSLQQHVVRQRNGVPSGGLQHRLDNHSLWHNAYRRSNDACTRAQDENEHLKREVARLQNELNVANEPTARSSRKRKTNADTGSTTNSTPKRMKATPDALPSFSYDEDLVLLDGTPKGRNTMRHLYRVFELIGKEETQYDTLALELSQTAMSLSSLVMASLRSPQSSSATGTNALLKPLSILLVPASRTFLALLRGLDHLDGSPKGRRLCGQVVYELVSGFKTILSALSEHAAMIAVPNAVPNISRGIKPSTRKSTTSTKRQDHVGHAELEQTTRLMLSFIKSLDSSRQMHRELFEGFLFVLLDHLGSTLYHITFSHARLDDMDLEIRSSAIELAKDSSSTEVRAAQTVAPYLITIFKQTMCLAPSHLDRSDTTSSNITNQTTPATQYLSVPRLSTLSKVAKDRLQRTLIKSTYGTAFSSNDAFADCLKMPDAGALTADIARPPSRKKDAGQGVGLWFTEELWDLLGWDIMARDEGYHEM